MVRFDLYGSSHLHAEEYFPKLWSLGKAWSPKYDHFGILQPHREAPHVRKHHLMFSIACVLLTPYLRSHPAPFTLTLPDRPMLILRGSFKGVLGVLRCP